MLGRVAQGHVRFLHCCPDGISGHPVHFERDLPTCHPASLLPFLPISDHGTLGRVLKPLGVHIWEFLRPPAPSKPMMTQNLVGRGVAMPLGGAPSLGSGPSRRPG